MSLKEFARAQGLYTRRQFGELVGKSAFAFALPPLSSDPQPDPTSPPKKIETVSIPDQAWKISQSYTSDYRRSEQYRQTNIIAGCNGLNNWFWEFDGSRDSEGNLIKTGKNVINPGESFSINSVLGNVKDYVWGYAIGPNLERMPVYGGGICQIPTTMFVSALKNGLYVEERQNHSYYNGWYFGDPKDPKEFGMDATIMIPGVDLVVRNTYDRPIRFFFRVENQHLQVDMYGPPDFKPYYVEIEGPTMLYPRRGVHIKDVGRFPWAAGTVVGQHVWRDSTKLEKLFDKKFTSYYKSSPYG